MKVETDFMIDGTTVYLVDEVCGIRLFTSDTRVDKQVVYFVDESSEVVRVMEITTSCGNGGIAVIDDFSLSTWDAYDETT